MTFLFFELMNKLLENEIKKKEETIRKVFIAWTHNDCLKNEMIELARLAVKSAHWN